MARQHRHDVKLYSKAIWAFLGFWLHLYYIQYTLWHLPVFSVNTDIYGIKLVLIFFFLDVVFLFSFGLFIVIKTFSKMHTDTSHLQGVKKGLIFVTKVTMWCIFLYVRANISMITATMTANWLKSRKRKKRDAHKVCGLQQPSSRCCVSKYGGQELGLGDKSNFWFLRI